MPDTNKLHGAFSKVKTSNQRIIYIQSGKRCGEAIATFLISFNSLASCLNLFESPKQFKLSEFNLKDPFLKLTWKIIIIKMK